jgi:hypothetical protein
LKSTRLKAAKAAIAPEQSSLSSTNLRQGEAEFKHDKEDSNR